MSFTAVSANILKTGSKSSRFLTLSVYEFRQGCICLTQTATIKSKAFKEPIEKPAPFPYKEKNYNFWRQMFDVTSRRFDENSKIIIVDGPIAAGKTKFAKQLACDLDMHHMEEANMDLRYITSFGFDLRKIDDKVPVSMQSFDEKKFCKDPRHLNAAAFQIWMYRLRYSLYVDALAHLFSTGEC